MLRKYRAGDREELLEIWAAASAQAHPFLSDGFQRQERANIRDVYLAKADTWVWEEDGRVRGFMALLGNEIGGLFVDPGGQRRGIGRALVARAQALHGDLEVEVFELNRVGRAFYEKAGFELIGRAVHEPTGFEVRRLRLAAGSLPDPALGRSGD